MTAPLPEVLNFDGMVGVADATFATLRPFGSVKAYADALPDIWHSNPGTAAAVLAAGGLAISGLGLGPGIASAAASAGHAVGL